MDVRRESCFPREEQLLRLSVSCQPVPLKLRPAPVTACVTSRATPQLEHRRSRVRLSLASQSCPILCLLGTTPAAGHILSAGPLKLSSQPPRVRLGDASRAPLKLSAGRSRVRLS